MIKKFSSRKDLLMGAIYLLLPGLLFYLIGLPGIRAGNFFLIALWLFILAIFIGLWTGVKYIINETDLSVKMGPFTERVVPIADILSIQRSYELRSSSSGPSFRKLKIMFKGGDALITPSCEDEFLQALKEVNPKIFIDLNMVSII